MKINQLVNNYWQKNAPALLWLGLYFGIGLAVFSAFSWLMVSHQEAIKQVILDYFLPSSWQSISEQLGMFLFESQAKVVLGNLILASSLVLASIILFPIKEKSSAEFEKAGNYQNGEAKEFPLYLQAWEETKLFLFYLTGQSIILWIGYYPFAWTKALSIGLSFWFLFFTFGVDFISPTLQRHRLTYSQIVKALAKKMPWVIIFGAAFSLPSVLLIKFMFTVESLSFIEITSILFLVNMLLLSLAIPFGTRIASRFIEDVRRTEPPRKATKRLLSGLMLSCLLLTLFLHSQLIQSLHHKSQLLKANYSVDWSGFNMEFDFNISSLKTFLENDTGLKISFDLAIENPTEYDIIIENSQLIAKKDDKVISEVNINGFQVLSGQKENVTIQLDSLSKLGGITEFATLLDGWQVDLYVDIWPGIPFIINLTKPN